MFKEVKKDLRNSILLPTLTYESETWTWNRAQQSRVHAVEITYLIGACGMTRWEGESNETVYERCGMGTCANRVKCIIVKWLKNNTERLFRHLERKKVKFVKKVYVSKTEDPRRRAVVRWKGRVEEYMHERIADGRARIEQARRVYG